MGKICPTCNKVVGKGKECPSCNLSPHTESTKNSVKSVRWYDALVVIVALVVIGLILTKVTIPYTEEERYTIQERYEEEESYVVKEDYVEKVPYTVTQLVVEEIPYTPEKKVIKEVCYYKDLPYQVNYLPGLQNPYNVATETGYRYNKGTVYGQYFQVAEVCRPPLREQGKDSRFRATFAICYYMGDKKVECPDRLETFGGYETGYNKKGTLEDPKYPGVRSRNEDLICFNADLIWETPYDERKSIRLEPIHLPQVRVCEKQEVTEKVNLYTTHNAIVKPTYKKVEKEVTKTMYRDETRTREVPKTRLVEKMRDVPKVRYLTKYRFLWEEIARKYELFSVA